VNCSTMNKPEDTRCVQCGESLLPGRTRAERKRALVWALCALLAAAVLFAAAVGLGKVLNIPSDESQRNFVQDFLFRLPVGLSVISLLGCFWLLWQAVGPTPKHERYWKRGLRHEALDAQQAESDFAEAIRLTPKDSLYRHERGLFFEQAGRLAEAAQDLEAAVQLIDRNAGEVREGYEMDLLRVQGKLSK
jgi:tetratricopeptide (TPR) repeat protein